MTEKKEKLWKKIRDKLKLYVPAALMLSSGLTTKAAADTDTGGAGLNEINKKENVNYKTGSKENITSRTFVMSTAPKAYPGKYYNEICNGSPCWLASTYETRGAGIGKKINSAGTWNDTGNYRGINQLSPQHAQKYLRWLKGKEEYKNVYNMLSKGGIDKGNWQKTSRLYENEMTLSQEDYLTQEYNPDNFKAVQDIINKSGEKINIAKLHPAIISCMHQLLIERPAWRGKIAKKIIDYTQKHDGDEKVLNSEEFIGILVKERSGDLVKKASALLKDSTISWKEKQFSALLSKVSPAHDDNQSWFSMQQHKLQKEKMLQLREDLKKQLANKKKSVAIASVDALEVRKIKNVSSAKFKQENILRLIKEKKSNEK